MRKRFGKRFVQNWRKRFAIESGRRLGRELGKRLGKMCGRRFGRRFGKWLGKRLGKRFKEEVGLAPSAPGRGNVDTVPSRRAGA